MPTEATAPIAIVHDYLTQRGGAERVVGVMAGAFPDAPIYTSLFDPAGTFEEFSHLDVRAGALNRVPGLRQHHRAALPFLAPWFATQHVDADVVLASSSGWAHEVRTDGRLIVYCHAPARWLYQKDRYLRSSGGGSLAKGVVGAGLAVLAPPLRHVDRAAARRAERYLANSRATAAQIQALYGLDAEVLAPPPALDATGPREPIEGLEPGFVLCVSRLLTYKHVDLVVAAASQLRDHAVVIVGDGPESDRLRAVAPSNVKFLGAVDDAQLRWCYSEASVLIALSYEDYGLTPLEAAACGTPTIARRFGGYLDTVRDGETGLLVEDVTASSIARAVGELTRASISREALAAHASRFSRARFVERLCQIVTAV